MANAKPVLISMFKHGEGIQMTFTLRNRAVGSEIVGTPLVDAASQVISFVISDRETELAIAEFNAPPDIVLADAVAAIWDVDLKVADLTAIEADKEYDFDIWSKLAGADLIHQRNGVFVLPQATPPT